MKTHAQVVVIGGGVVGCSVLYHLTKLGWSDVLLVERSDLTSGSTWHAAGGFHTLNGDHQHGCAAGLPRIRLYRELEEITGMSCGLPIMSAASTLADTPERFDMLKAERAKTSIHGPRDRASRPGGDRRHGAHREHRRRAWARFTIPWTDTLIPPAPPCLCARGETGRCGNRLCMTKVIALRPLCGRLGGGRPEQGHDPRPNTS